MINTIIKPIILLSGPPGAGKTTVAQELIKSAIDPTVYIEGDKFWFFVVKEDKSIGRGGTFRTIMTSTVAASIPYALSGYEVILDFSIPPWFLKIARKILAARNIPFHYIVLRPGETICAQRAASRPEGAIADYSSYHDFYMSFDEAKPYQLCDDTNDAAAIAAKIKKALAENKFRFNGV